jgi:AraC-like DNA-binding protein
LSILRAIGWFQRARGGRVAATDALFDDPMARQTCHVTHVRDPNEMDRRSLVSERFPRISRAYKYRLRDRALMRARFEHPIFSLAIAQVGSMLVSEGADRFATEITIEGELETRFYFNVLRHGGLSAMRHGREVSGFGSVGLATRAEPGVQFVTSDFCARSNLFVRAVELEAALTRMLDDRLREPLEFAASFDWSIGKAASVRHQLDFLIGELRRPDGLASNPIAVASATDLMHALVLGGIPHNYMARLEAGRTGATPAYLRRAEAFMREHAGTPLRMAEVADAAGCGVRTLSDVFRRFRETTPLKALHAIRLECVRDALHRDATDSSVGDIARRFGFTNAGRFTRSYRQRFAETPAETRKRPARSN